MDTTTNTATNIPITLTITLTDLRDMITDIVKKEINQCKSSKIPDTYSGKKADIPVKLIDEIDEINKATIKRLIDYKTKLESRLNSNNKAKLMEIELINIERTKRWKQRLMTEMFG